jgi:hypothetical protein
MAVACAEPVSATVAELGLPSDAPTAFDSWRLKVRVPENGVLLLTATEKVFAAASPLA